jgi:hypothetical protein
MLSKVAPLSRWRECPAVAALEVCGRNMQEVEEEKKS